MTLDGTHIKTSGFYHLQDQTYYVRIMRVFECSMGIRKSINDCFANCLLVEVVSSNLIKRSLG